MSSPARYLTLAAVFSVAALAVVGFANAGEATKMPVLQKPVAHPLLDAMAGSWTTTSTTKHEGKDHQGAGKATFARGIGGTALIQTYENTGPGPDGKTMTFHGHGIYKISDDGKTVTVWWFCNMSPDVVKLTGPVTESKLELSGDSPHGGRMDLSFEKTADGFSFRLKDDMAEMEETYRRGARP